MNTTTNVQSLSITLPVSVPDTKPHQTTQNQKSFCIAEHLLVNHPPLLLLENGLLIQGADLDELPDGLVPLVDGVVATEQEVVLGK